VLLGQSALGGRGLALVILLGGLEGRAPPRSKSAARLARKASPDQLGLRCHFAAPAPARPAAARALWSDPSSPQRERERIAPADRRCHLNRTAGIHMHVRFRGGQTTSLTLALGGPLPGASAAAGETVPLAGARSRRPLDIGAFRS
jgi:hypothetical protein